MLAAPQRLITARQALYIQITLMILIGVLIGSIVILSWVPPVSRDALTHHLAVPNLYLQKGGIYEIPSIGFSYYPMNLDLLYMIPLYFDNDIVPKFTHFLFALLTAWLIYSYLKKKLGGLWALLGALFFLSLPIIVKLSITVYVDLGLVFFSTASILVLLKWVESRFQINFLLWSAVYCGLALGTKYNALIVLFLLTAFIPLIYLAKTRNAVDREDEVESKLSAKHQLKAISLGAIFFAVALIVFSPWMIRNYVWKGNPIYPLYNGFFQALNPGSIDTAVKNAELSLNETRMQSSQNSTEPWGTFAIRKVIYGESWWEIVMIPIRIFFQGQDDNPKYFDGRLSPFLFILPFFAFIPIKNYPLTSSTEKKIWVLFAVFFLLFAIFQTSIRIRYVAPIIPPLVILAMFGLHRIAALVSHRMTRLPGWVSSGCVLLLITLMLSINGAYVIKQFTYVEPLSYISGQVSRDDYIAKYRPEYSIFQYTNKQLPESIKLLGLFLGNRRYYSDRDLIFGVDLFKDIVNVAVSEDIVLTELQKKGFTHLIIRYDLFNSWNNKQFNDSKKEILKLFFARHVRHLLSNGGYGLFELESN